MKPSEIDQMIDAMVAEAAKAGDDGLLPGAIFLHPDHYISSGLKSECITMVIGHRYRGVRLFVSREFESRVVARVDLQRDVGEFMPVTSAG
jgi:hypothetical protein